MLYGGFCPRDRVAFGQWVTKIVKDMASPDDTHAGYSWIQSCQSELPVSDRNAVEKCTANLKSLDVTFDYSKYGLNVSPEPDPAKVPPLTLPPALNDLDILAAMKAGTKAELDQQLARLSAKLPKSARIVEFMSGSSHRRTVTVILPGKNEDVFFHYIGDVKHPGPPYRADVIRVNHHGDLKGLPTLDYFSADDGTPPRPMADRCNSCHRTGSRAIVPQDGIVRSHTPHVTGPDFQKWFDDRRPVLEKKPASVNYEHLAPEFGGDQNIRSPAATTNFIARCSQHELPSITPVQIERIGKAMNCVGCHSEDGRPELLRYPMDIREFYLNTLDNIIIRGHMPQGSDNPPGTKSHLQPAERKALLRCLKQDYFGGFKDDYWSQGNREPGTLMKYLTKNCDAASLAFAPAAVVPNGLSTDGRSRVKSRSAHQ